MKTSGIVGALALMSATSAVAQQQAQQQAQAAEQAPEEKKICKTERVTGSLTRVNRVCATKAEWDQVSASAKKTLDDVSRTAGTAGNLNNSTGFGPGGL